MKQITLKGLSESLVHFSTRGALPLFLFLGYILWPHSGLEKYLSEMLCNRGKIVGVSNCQ
jgi:hypothetical protein